nr:hypothetical protein [Tanacetum cinerariifolium]
ANVVADALSRKSRMIAGIKVEEEIIRELERLDIELYVRGQHGYLASLRVEPDLISRIKEAQKEDNEIWTIVKIEHQRASGLLRPLDNPVWNGSFDRVGEVSYRLALPPQLSHVHNVFYVSLLRGYKYHPLHVISYPLDQIRTDLTYVEEPEAILDRQDRVMRKKTIPFVKILWRNHPERVATWETEESIWTSYPHFLPRSVVKMGIDGECGYEGVVVK